MTLLLLLQTTAEQGDDFQRLVQWMEGSFSSAKQAQEDPDFFEIELEMVRIWPSRTDGAWLYVEQAAAASKNKPYRQRIYHVVPLSEDTWVSDVFTLADPEAVVGQFKDPSFFTSLNPDQLVVKQGCGVILKKSAEGFSGQTRDRECKSDLRGASYATSEVRILEDRIISWDRGFDDNGIQVWGAEKGGYLFLKRSSTQIRQPETSAQP
jgi:hypothetical protein